MRLTEQEFEQIKKRGRRVVTATNIELLVKPKPQLPTESEHEIQTAFFDWIAIFEGRHPELRMFAAIPNGTYKGFMARLKYKSEGLRSGLCDVVGFIAKQNKHGILIEFKREKGGRISENQRRWIHDLRLNNYRVEVCYSAEEAISLVIDYLGLEIKKL